MARGNRRGETVSDDHDRRRFAETLEEAGEASGRVLCAWVLMSNHCHFPLRWQRQALVPATGGAPSTAGQGLWLPKSFGLGAGSRLSSTVLLGICFIGIEIAIEIGIDSIA